MWEWYVTFGASKWPLFCMSHVMILHITIVCKGLVTFGTGKWLPPVWTLSWIFVLSPFSKALQQICSWKVFGLIIICFGTYSILFILHWDLFHSFNISLCTCFTVLTITYDLLHSWIFFNDSSNLKQANNLSPVWILSCIFKTLQCVNDMPHLVQEYGFSAPRILW